MSITIFQSFSALATLFVTATTYQAVQPYTAKQAHYILGLKITRNRSERQLSLSQQEYVRRVVERYGMTDCNPAATPLTMGTVLSKDDCPSSLPTTPATINGHTYASVVGAIITPCWARDLTLPTPSAV